MDAIALRRWIQMVEFVCMFVVKDLQDGEIKYAPKEMEGVFYPTNCTDDINALVAEANSTEEDKHIEYLDVFGIHKKDGMIYWESENNG